MRAFASFAFLAFWDELLCEVFATSTRCCWCMASTTGGSCCGNDSQRGARRRAARGSFYFCPKGGRLRALIEDASITLSQSQVLDLSAALIGLRNWPEVQAFPQRARSTDLDLSAVSRLAYGLKYKAWPRGQRPRTTAIPPCAGRTGVRSRAVVLAGRPCTGRPSHHLSRCGGRMRHYPAPIMLPATAATSALAPDAIRLLQAALARRSTGTLAAAPSRCGWLGHNLAIAGMAGFAKTSTRKRGTRGE